MRYIIALSALFCALIARAGEAPAPAKSKYQAILANIEVGGYATAQWRALGGAVQTGGGIFAELPFSERVGLRLSVEADSWNPDNSLVDRGWIDLRIYAPVSDKARLYGLAGFGYRRVGEDILARAGAGFDVLLFKLGPVKTKLFVEGSLQASTGEWRGAALASGLNLSF